MSDTHSAPPEAITIGVGVKVATGTDTCAHPPSGQRRRVRRVDHDGTLVSEGAAA